MKKSNIEIKLKDKIFEIIYDSGTVSKIKSYFPLSIKEQEELMSIFHLSSDGFSSIFTDSISDEEWEKSKEQIKKKFHDELFDIDKNL